MGKYFGTDGIRGIANRFLTCDFCCKIGKSISYYLNKNNIEKKSIKIIIGKDTRLSCDMIESSLIGGISSFGCDVELVGIVPTPAIPFFVKKYSADCGIMISASHNSYEFNGIKIFGKDGYKLSDQQEMEIEKNIDSNIDDYMADFDKIGIVTKNNFACDRYIDYIENIFEKEQFLFKVGVDCSNGSSSRTAYKLFTKLGIDCHIIDDLPDGKNINDKCGSTYIENISNYVIQNKLDFGVAFDGDADRCILVDEFGNVIDGDFILGIISKYLKNKNSLNKDFLVMTTMTNMGLIQYCKDNFINTIITDVGDKNVLEKMIDGGYNLGGEQSGHIILKNYSTTGDGQISALYIMKILKEYGKSLFEVASEIKKYPQLLYNIILTDIRDKNILEEEYIKSLINNLSNDLGDNGRIVVRPSGTEPIIRVMVEGKDGDIIKTVAEKIVEKIKKGLNIQ